MPYRCLAEFIEELSQAGELVREDGDIDAAEELAERIGAAARAGGPALLFGSVRGCDLPVAANLLADERRIRRALGIGSLDALADRISRWLEDASAPSWLERLRGASRPTALARFEPREVKSAPCQQILRLGGDVDLAVLPWLGPSPGGILADATVLSAEPDSHWPVFSRCMLHRLDRNRLAIRWSLQDEHVRLAGEYRARHQKMPLAVVFGGDPATMLAAAAPLPQDADMFAVAGLLREKPLDVVPCRTVDLLVPAEAEIVLEGFLDENAGAAEGNSPIFAGFAATMGTVSGSVSEPVMQTTALTHRANPVFIASVPTPPNEACAVARAMHRVFLPLLRQAMPVLADFDLPECAGARNLAVVSIRKTHAGQGRWAAHAAWALRPMAHSKMLVVVDADVDVRNLPEVLAAAAAHVNPPGDVIFERGPADPLDPTAARRALVGRMALDATRKLPEERAA